MILWLSWAHLVHSPVLCVIPGITDAAALLWELSLGYKIQDGQPVIPQRLSHVLLI
jgi:hypothetical protein